MCGSSSFLNLFCGKRLNRFAFLMRILPFAFFAYPQRIHTHHRDLADWHRWRAHDPTQDASVRRLYPQTQTQPHPGSSTARQAQRLDHLTQSARRASPRLKKRRETLGKDFASALAVVTEECAHTQDQLYPTASTSQISSRSRVAAMHTRAFLRGARTCCLRQR